LEALPSPDTPPRSTATANVSTRRRSRRQIEIQLIKTSETQPDDTDDNFFDADYVDDDGDSSGPATPTTATVSTSICRRSSRHLITTSITGAAILRKSQRQAELPSIETTEAQLEAGDGDADLSGPSSEDRLGELADYRKIHRHCNVPQRYSENTKLGWWVSAQKKHYKLRLEGKKSQMTLPRIQELESLGFEWDSRGATWEERFNELANYRRIHRHCNVPKKYSENDRLGRWVHTQRLQYRRYLEGNPSHMTLSRIQKLESLAFEWNCNDVAWEDRLSELADYRNLYGHCNVPRNYVENHTLANWVTTQRVNYRWHKDGKQSPMSPFRIQELECLGLEWDSQDAVWVERLSELADYRRIHGHCNVPHGYSENTKLALWVSKQRQRYKLHLKGETSSMTPFRIQALESLGFEWKKSTIRGKGTRKISPILDRR
jgi:hypothetical protein